MDARRKTSRADMDASRRKRSGIKTSAEIGVSLGKENVCPSLFCDSELAGTSRSPLPEGFPRLPLQDITHVLNPNNMLPHDDFADQADQAQPQCKRLKFRMDAHTISKWESEEGTSDVAWVGLRQCSASQAPAELHIKEDENGSELKLAAKHDSSAQSPDAMLSEVEAGSTKLAGEHDVAVKRTDVSPPLRVSEHCQDLANLAKKVKKLAPSSSLSGAVTSASSRSSQPAAKPKNSILKFR